MTAEGMLEIGIFLAVLILLILLILIVLLIFIGPILVVFSAMLSWFFVIGIGGGLVWFFSTYLDLFSASLVLATIAIAIAGFGYWWHVDTRFHHPEKDSSY